MDNGFLSGFFTGACVVAFAFAVLALALNLQPSPNLTECARMNNGYACELVAVPVVPE